MSQSVDVIEGGVTNSYLIRDRGAVLVDPGGHAQKRKMIVKLAHLLGDGGSLRLIVITHAHFDHAGAAAAVREATGAPVAIHRDDSAWLREGEVLLPKGTTAWGRLFRTTFMPLMLPFVKMPALEPDIVVDGEELDLLPFGISGRLLHTPGHSPGSASVLLDSGEAFVGDLAMNGPPFCLRPRFGIFAHEPERVLASYENLLRLGARRIFPAHGRPFPAGPLF
jgi:glyoxylase-like metal-dependent hydrolase (beta-lactamase superfamily II)